jgi:hypothetical protein
MPDGERRNHGHLDDERQGETENDRRDCRDKRIQDGARVRKEIAIPHNGITQCTRLAACTMRNLAQKSRAIPRYSRLFVSPFADNSKAQRKSATTIAANARVPF